MNQPTMADAYDKAVRIIGDQSVQLALLTDALTQLEAEVASLRPAPLSSCHDCHVNAGVPHLNGCDMARCTVCGKRRITCEHRETDIGWGEVWQGASP